MLQIISAQLGLANEVAPVLLQEGEGKGGEWEGETEGEVLLYTSLCSFLHIIFWRGNPPPPFFLAITSNQGDEYSTTAILKIF